MYWLEETSYLSLNSTVVIIQDMVTRLGQQIPDDLAELLGNWKS